jgi:hypothetical protein
MPELLQFKDFLPLLNQEFQIEQEPGKWVPVELIETTELKFNYPVTGGEGRTPFSIVFRASPEVQLLQKNCLIKHSELGEHQIFIVPLQPDENGTYYEAVYT